MKISRSRINDWSEMQANTRAHKQISACPVLRLDGRGIEWMLNKYSFFYLGGENIREKHNVKLLKSMSCIL